MRVYLDDVRPIPEGMVGARWASDVINLLETGQVTYISLDHDLGDDNISTGYDVLTWLEEKLLSGQWEELGYNFPILNVHSMNPVAVDKMKRLSYRLMTVAMESGIILGE